MLGHHEMVKPKVNESKGVNLETDSEPQMVKIGPNLPAV